MQHGSGLREHVLLFSRFLRSPRTVGAFTASSQALAAAMVEALKPGEPSSVVELGPGTGAFTGAIIERIGPGGRCLAVDIEPAFVEQIRKSWPEVECVCASAEQLAELVAERQFGPVRHIISGLPFASLPQPVTTQIITAISRTLAPGGTFTTFQYVYAFPMPLAFAFRQAMSRELGDAPVRRLVMMNMPPALTLTWLKRAALAS
jgi:phosphatidylethanolamine/phosphatidyl-N-methylethanolamine N-methyltransferase